MYSKYIKTFFALLLCLSMLASLNTCAYAQEAESSIIDEAELQGLVEDFIAQRGIEPENFSIGYKYTATGDEWFFNGDEWFYPASMYKVPLMMLLAEKVAMGEMTQDTYIFDKTVGEIESLVLSYSNNDWAHVIRKELGGDEFWRQEAKRLTTLDEADYDPDYMDYCYFNNRYITGVMDTLYSYPESFPNILDCLYAAMPGRYYRLSLEGQYNIAQKYGSFEDMQGQKFNHNTGIIFTPNPMILTVMTCDVQNYERVIADVALMMVEYTLGLDSRLETYEEEQQAAAIAAEQQAALELEQAQQEKLQAEEAARLEAERMEAERLQQEKTDKLKTVGIIAGSGLLVLALLIILISGSRKKKARRRAAAKRQAEAMRQRQRASGESPRSKYTPKH